MTTNNLRDRELELKSRLSYVEQMDPRKARDALFERAGQLSYSETKKLEVLDELVRWLDKK